MNDLFKMEQLYSNATKQLINSFSRFEKNRLIDIYPFVTQIGKNYENSDYKMMFIGKATNGWVFPVSCNTTEQEIEKTYRNMAFNKECKDRLVHRTDEMQWVENLAGPNDVYNTNRSQFWSVIKKVSEKLEGATNWSSKIAWSNLYKFAPYEGNPSGELKRNQEENCWTILDEEIEIIKPRCIVFLTSGWEKKYLAHRFNHLPNRQTVSFNRNGKTKTYYFSYFFDNETLIIDSLHPQGKPVQEHADKLCEIILDSLH